MRATYFASDLTDAATVRRIQILRMAGTEVTVLGFRRSPDPVLMVDDMPVIDLGETFDARLGLRCFQVLRRAIEISRLRAVMADADVVIGRNLEMVTFANIARFWAWKDIPLVYECLDINAAFVTGGFKETLLRWWEGFILRRCNALVTSSPNFIPQYFARLGVPLPTVVIAENKRVVPDPGSDRSEAYDGGQPPWRIGWFGKLRCERSYEILLSLARRHPTLVDITLRGTPINALPGLIERDLPSMPNMRFGGPYEQDELGAMYGQCDLTWAIEYFGEGSNSDWCLPNRIYEGGYYNVPSIALRNTTTADWLIERHTGILLNSHDELDDVLVNMTPEAYRELRRTSAAIPTADLAWMLDECQTFAAKIAQRRHIPRSNGLAAELLDAWSFA